MSAADRDRIAAGLNTALAYRFRYKCLDGCSQRPLRLS